MKIYANCPSEKFCLSATVTFPGVFDPLSCPWRVKGPSGKTYGTQWSLVANLNGKFLAEISASIDEIYSGKQMFELVPGPNESHGISIKPVLLPALTGMFLSFEGQQPNQNFGFGLDFLETAPDFCREGDVRTQIKIHKEFPDVGLGVHAFLEYRAFANSMGLILNFHNAGLPAKSDYYFKSIILNLPFGLDFTEELNYGTRQGGFLVKPDLHVVPQRMQFSRRLQIHKIGAKPHMTIWGQGFQNYFLGGYCAQDFEVGHQPNVQALFDKEYAEIKKEFDQDLPDNTGNPTLPHLWKAAGVPYGGMTGGEDVHAIIHSKIPDSKDPKGVEFLYMRQYRYHARNMGAIYKDGEPIKMEEYLNADGSTPWDMFSNKFQKGKDAPFNFDTVPQAVGTCPYQAALENTWSPIDDQHQRRIEQHDVALAWLANDPLAKLYLEMEAELSKMSYWTGKGGKFEPQDFPVGNGTDWGRELAWVLDTVTHAAILTKDLKRNQNNVAWITAVTNGLTQTQLATGWVNTKRTGKVMSEPPFNSGYWVGQAFEHCLVAVALMGVYGALGLGQTCLRNMLFAMKDYAWRPGTDGIWYKVPTHKKDANGAFQKLPSIPTDGIMQTVLTENGEIQSLIGMAYHLLGVQAFNELILKHSKKADLNQALTFLQSKTNFDHLSNALAIAQKTIGGQKE